MTSADPATAANRPAHRCAPVEQLSRCGSQLLFSARLSSSFRSVRLLSSGCRRSRVTSFPPKQQQQRPLRPSQSAPQALVRHSRRVALPVAANSLLHPPFSSFLLFYVLEPLIPPVPRSTANSPCFTSKKVSLRSCQSLVRQVLLSRLKAFQKP